VGLIEPLKTTDLEVLPCRSAKSSRGSSVLEEISRRGGGRAVLRPGEHIDLEFDAGQMQTGEHVFLLARGQYSRGEGVPEATAPPVFYLRQNSPNPFNPATTIELGLPTSSRVTLRLYSSSGRLVRRLVEADLPAGRHVIRWDGRDDQGQEVGSGVYFYEARAKGFADRKKMILLR